MLSNCQRSTEAGCFHCLHSNCKAVGQLGQYAEQEWEQIKIILETQ